MFINRRRGLHGEKKVNFSILLQVSGWNIIPATNDSYIGARYVVTLSYFKPERVEYQFVYYDINNARPT